MPDTEYTKGFKAGMAWREAEIIKLLDSIIQVTSANQTDEVCKNDALCEAIALIKGEK
jgi:hypothetical protein